MERVRSALLAAVLATSPVTLVGCLGPNQLTEVDEEAQQAKLHEDQGALGVEGAADGTQLTGAQGAVADSSGQAVEEATVTANPQNAADQQGKLTLKPANSTPLPAFTPTLFSSPSPEPSLSPTPGALPEDRVAPRLNYLTVHGGYRIRLGFSEPMVDDRNDGLAANGVLDLSNYSFLVADKVSDIFHELWDESAVRSTITTFAEAKVETRHFRFAAGQGITITINKFDPRDVIIESSRRATLDKFPVGIRGIKVRVDPRVTDVAGNPIVTSGDANYYPTAF